jgi:hypothetical protein
LVIPLILGGLARAGSFAARGIARTTQNIKRGINNLSQKVKNPKQSNIEIQNNQMAPIQGIPGQGRLSGIRQTAGRFKGYGMTALAAGGGVAAGSMRYGASALGKTSGAGVLLLPIFLWIFDFATGINGIDFAVISIDGFDIILKTLQGALFLIFLGLFLIIRKPTTISGFGFPIAFFFLFSMIWSFGRANLWIYVHLIFSFIVFAFLLKGFDKNTEIGGAHWFFLIVMAWDLFALPSVGAIIPDNSEIIFVDFLNLFTNKLLFPVWIFFFFTFIQDSSIKKSLLSFLYIFYIGYIGLHGYNMYGDVLEQRSDEDREDVIGAPKKVINQYVDLIRTWFSGRIEYAITGKVEENEFEPLGVGLKDVQSADDSYFIDEDVIIWGTVTARTLDDPININVGCFTEKDDDKLPADDVDPDKTFSVFTLEEQDFACTFKGCDIDNDPECKSYKLDSGSKTVTTFARFNFETLAYLKTYFIDRERQRAMTREGLNVFEEFAINDKNPVAVYTNGPVMIGMAMNNPLVGVSDDYLVKPTLRVSLQNREGWEGKISSINELVLFLPEGVALTACNKDSKPYTLGTENDHCSEDTCNTCYGSCDKFVLQACMDVCSGFKSGTTDRNYCESDCNRNHISCQNDCSILFSDSGQAYQGHTFLIEDNTNKDSDESITTNFRCQLDPDRATVLGKSPLTTKSIRAKARYNYILENSVSVNIKKLPEDTLVPGNVGKAQNLNGKIENGDITLTWDRSINDGIGGKWVTKYSIFRKENIDSKPERKGTITELGHENYEWIDSDVDLSGTNEYYYYIRTFNENEYEESSKMVKFFQNSVEVLDYQ